MNKLGRTKEEGGLRDTTQFIILQIFNFHNIITRYV